MDEPNYRKTSGGLEQIHHVGLHISARSSTDFGASKSRHTPGVPGHRPSVIRVVERSGIRGGSYDVTFTRSGQPTSPSSVDPLVSLDVNGVQKFRNPHHPRPDGIPYLSTCPNGGQVKVWSLVARSPWLACSRLTLPHNFPLACFLEATSESESVFLDP